MSLSCLLAVCIFFWKQCRTYTASSIAERLSGKRYAKPVEVLAGAEKDKGRQSALFDTAVDDRFNGS